MSAYAQIAGERVKARDEDLQWLLSSHRGRRLAAWVIYDLGGLEDSSFHADAAGYSNAAIKSGDAAAMHMSLAEGRRDLARRFKRLAQQFPDEYGQMMAERTLAEVADLAKLKQPAGEQS